LLPREKRHVRGAPQPLDRFPPKTLGNLRGIRLGNVLVQHGRRLLARLHLDQRAG
jgi:hypothetical protein